MTDPQYRLDVTTSDGKYTVRQLMSGASTALRYGEPWPAYEGKLLSNLELALAQDLAEAQARLVEIDASEVLPIETAPKDGRMLQLLVRYDRDSDDDHPLDDEAWNRPSWTIGFNTLGDTGEDFWRIAGWCWSQDCFTEGRGTPVGWLPFHGAQMDEEPLPGFLSDVIAERIRQITEEGWTPEHDDDHDCGEMARAAAAYAIHASWPYYGGEGDDYPGVAFWPWDASWWKPKDRRSDLIKAAALMIAEGERLDRRDGRTPTPEPGAPDAIAAPCPVTVAELLARGMDGRMQEIVSLMAGEILRDPVTKNLSPDELAAFGFGPSCPCGERGLRPGEVLPEDGESCAECRSAESGEKIHD